MRMKMCAKLMSGLLTAVLVGGIVGVPTSASDAKKERTGTGKVPVLKGQLPVGAKLNATELARHVDIAVNGRLTSEKVVASPRCSDEEFLRRVYLDLAGKIPTVEQSKAFLGSTDSNRRAKLIDELLASKDYGVHLADLYLKQMMPPISDNARLRQFYPNLGKWMTEKFNENKPWNQMVKEILTATGTADKESPAIYFMANLSVDKITDNVTKVFMGVRLECAQCHNHPFTDYKQDQYWEMAAFFTKVRVTGNVKQVGKKADAASVGIGEGPTVIRNKKTLPESAKILSPRFLQGDAPVVKGTDPFRPVLADWLAKNDNPFLSKATVNRVWGQLFGRGIVNPIDDMHNDNAPTNPELLADLTQQFVANGFDLKYLYRAICNSESYQRTSKPTGNNVDAPNELFSRMIIKALTPEQLFDSLTVVLGSGRAPVGKIGGPIRGAPINARAAFVAFFNLDEGADPLEFNAGIPQVLRLMNSPQFNSPGALGNILKTGVEPRQAVEAIYLSALSRKPSAEEMTRLEVHLRKYRDEPRRAYADILWALINSSEFQLNR